MRWFEFFARSGSARRGWGGDGVFVWSGGAGCGALATAIAAPVVCGGSAGRGPLGRAGFRAHPRAGDCARAARPVFAEALDLVAIARAAAAYDATERRVGS